MNEYFVKIPIAILLALLVIGFLYAVGLTQNKAIAEDLKKQNTPHEIVCDNPLIGERRAGAPTRFFWDSNGHIRNKENTIHFVPMQGDICEIRVEEPVPMEDLVPLLPDTGSYAVGPENG